MAGVNRDTGKLLDGWPHVVQSIGVLLSTHYSTRVMRRYFGSNVPKLLGENLTPRTILRFRIAVAIALDLWEPRFRLLTIVPTETGNSPENLRLGRLSLMAPGIYMPRGHLGDFTPAGSYTLTIASGGDNGVIIT